MTVLLKFSGELPASQIDSDIFNEDGSINIGVSAESNIGRRDISVQKTDLIYIRIDKDGVDVSSKTLDSIINTVSATHLGTSQS